MHFFLTIRIVSVLFCCVFLRKVTDILPNQALATKLKATSELEINSAEFLCVCFFDLCFVYLLDFCLFPVEFLG